MKKYLLIDSKTSIQRNSAWHLIKISTHNGKIIKKENTKSAIVLIRVFSRLKYHIINARIDIIIKTEFNSVKPDFNSRSLKESYVENEERFPLNNT